jgi:hypothetical protein
MPVMQGYRREALAERAGVDPGYVDRLLELGILDDPGADSSFSVGDVRRVRLLRGLDAGGLPLDAIATAVRRGDLAFRFLDLESWDWYGGFLNKTYGELSRETGIDLDLLRILRESMGFARPRPDDPVHEEALEWIRRPWRASSASGGRACAVSRRRPVPRYGPRGAGRP